MTARRRRIAAVTWAIALATVVLVGVARLEVDTGVESLLPGGDDRVERWQEAQQSFGGDPVVVLLRSEEPAELLAPSSVAALARLEGVFARLPDVAAVYGPGTSLNQIADQLQRVLAGIAGRRDGIRAAAEQEARRSGADEEAVQREADEAVRRFERRYGALLVEALPVGLPTLSNPSFAANVVLDGDRGVRDLFHWIIPDTRHVAVHVRTREGLDQAAAERLVEEVRLAAVSSDIPGVADVEVTGAPAIAAALGEQVRRELPVLGAVALVVVAACFVRFHRVPGPRRLAPLAVCLASTSLTLAGLGWLGVPVSIGMLAFLPILLGVGSDFPIYAAAGTRPARVLATAAASAAAFGALMFSPVPFVRMLGVALAAGVLVSAVAGVWLARSMDVGQLGDVDPVPAGPAPVRPWARRAVAVGAVVAAVGWLMLPGQPVEADVDRLAAGLPALEQARAAEEVLGASGEVAVHVRAPDVLAPDVLAWFQQVEDAFVAELGDRLRPVVSPARLFSWLGPDPTSAQIEAAFSLLPSYLRATAVRSDRAEAVATFGVPLGRLDEQSRLLDRARELIPEPPPRVDVELTGLPVVAAHGHDLVSAGRVATNVAGIVAFVVVLAVGLRRRGPVLAAAAAATMACGWGIVVLRVTDTPLSPLTVALGSLTAAVGGEYVVMALDRLKRGRRPWPPVYAAAVTSAAAFATLALSRLEMLRQFGVVLAGSVLLATVAARLVLAVVPAPSVDGRRSEGSAADRVVEQHVEVPA